MAQGVTLSAVGDIMLGDSPQVFGFGVGSQIRINGPLHPFAYVQHLLSGADITVGNLEIVISAFDPEATPFESQIYRAQPEAVEGLAASGFDALSLCTNHMMQHGRPSFEETVELIGQRGISVIGAECPGLGLSNEVLLERKGLRFALLGYNFRPEQYFLDQPAWSPPDFELIRKDIARVRARADVVLMTVHWGDEFMDCPAPWQVELAHRLVDAGADIIIGHHPHMLQGVERYKGSVIAYSLGNFVFDQWQHRLRLSAILSLTVRGSRDMDCHLEPLMLNKAHQPVPMHGRELDRAKLHLQALATKIGKWSPGEYERDLRANFRRFRREVYLHYLSNFWRFRPRYLLANLGGAILKRLPRQRETLARDASGG